MIAGAFAAEWAEQLARLLESMTGEAVAAEVCAPPEGEGLLWYGQRLASGTQSAALFAGIEPEACRDIGQELQHAAGLDDLAAQEARRTCFEAMAEAGGAAARALTGRLGFEMRCEGGAGAEGPEGGAALFGIRLVRHGEQQARIALAIGDEVEAFAPRQAVQQPSRPNPAALDLLMDVELPVAVSFGRARMALKDVLRLASGSIVQLNRAAADLVEIVVNNCVIARGEVVIVDGNYGVRIVEIASRQERLKTVS